MKERDVKAAIRLELGADPDLALWNNAVGVVTVYDGERGPRVIRYGLAPGSGDLIGILRGGRFLSVETKATGQKARADQEQWARLIRSYGGFACVVDSVDGALAAIERAKSGGDR